MKMKSKLLYVPMVMAVMSALVVTATTTTKKNTTPVKTTTTTTTRTTTGPPGLNLNGKMFTLSYNGGGIAFYPPYFSPTPPPTPYPTRHYTTRPYYTTTPTAPPTRGVSMCLRYLADNANSLFTLSPSSRNPLYLTATNVGAYTLNFGGQFSLYMQPNVRFWSNVGPDIWIRVCLTIDSVKNVAQVFSGSNISVRKMLPIRYAWSGEPVIDVSGFDGQVTDIQIWDYPLRYKEVFNYMTSGVYGQYSGSVLSWSHISYSPRGNILLEDTFEWQARQPINSIRGRKGRRVKGGMKIMEFFNVEESQREQL